MIKLLIFRKKWLILCETLIILLSSFAIAQLLSIFTQITNSAISQNWRQLAWWFIIEGLIFLFLIIITPIKEFLLRKIIWLNVWYLRSQLTSKLTIEKNEKFNTKSFSNTYIHDSSQYIINVYQSLFNIFELSAQMLAIIISLMILNIYLGLIGICLIVIGYGLTFPLNSKVNQQKLKISNLRIKSIKMLSESLDAFPRLYFLNETELIEKLNIKSINNFEDMNFKYSLTKNFKEWLIEAFIYSVFVIFYVVIGLLIFKKLASVGVLVGGAVLFNNLFGYLNRLGNSFAIYKSFNKIGKRIFKEITLLQNSKNNKISLLNPNNIIKVKNVNYNYLGNKILSNISFVIKDNAKVLIHGDSGTGKTTLVKLILSLQNPSKGSITWNDQNLNSSQIFKKAIYVQNDLFIFDGDVNQNITLFHQKINQEKLAWARHVANIDFESDNSLRLSEGQKQRIEIASALYFSKKTIIFDESFANLDSDNRQSIIDKILNLKNYQIIIISHHLQKKQIQKFDQVIKLK